MQLIQGPTRQVGGALAAEADPVQPADDRRQADLADMLAILRARWRLAAGVAAVVFAGAVAYLMLAPRLYTGEASILIDARSRGPVGDANAGLNAFPDAVLVESQVRLISSEPVLRRVVEAEHLVDDPEFAPPRPGLRTRLFRMLGLARATPPDDPVARIIGTLASHIGVKRSERTYIADIDVTWRDPVMAARLANAVAQAYFEDSQAARVGAAARDSDWVLGQVKDMQAALQTAETRAADYRSRHGIIDVNGKLLIEQNLSEAATALTQARAKVADTRARYDQIEKALAAGHTADTLPDALKSPAIDKLKAQYADISRQSATLRESLGARHPALLATEQQMRDVRRLLDEELKRIEAGLANEYQTAQANVTMLEGQVQGLKTGTATSNEDRVKLAELERDVDARRTVLDRFLRARDTVKEQASDTPSGRLIAPATVPTAPSSPKTLAVLALGAMAGLLFGVGAALATHTLGRAGPALLRRPLPAAPVEAVQALPLPKTAAAADVPADLLPVLGTVPSPLGESEAADSRPRLIEGLRAIWPTAAASPAAAPSDAFRAAVARLPLDLDADRGGVATLVLTSEPGDERRTLLALGLAGRVAQLGLRPLVIDAEGGRTNLLRDLIEPGAAADLLDLMGTTRVCYRAVTEAAETVGLVPKLADEARVVQRLRGREGVRHLEGLRGHFDVVVFDGPSLAMGDRLRDVARSSRQVIVVAPPDAPPAVLAAAVADADLPAAVQAGIVLMEPGLDPAHASAA